FYWQSPNLTAVVKASLSTVRHFLFPLLICVPISAFAVFPTNLPQDLTVRVWGKREGLPDNSVNSVLQTRDGYLWVGTAGGLARFDGVRFVPIRPSDGPATLSQVTALCEDSAARLWIGTQKEGLFWYARGALHPFEDGGNTLLASINSIAEDASGALWVGTPTGLS